LLGLRRQDQNVVDIKLDVLGTTDCRQILGDIFVRRTQPQATLIDG
jgi:hypothetical protein